MSLPHTTELELFPSWLLKLGWGSPFPGCPPNTLPALVCLNLHLNERHIPHSVGVFLKSLGTEIAASSSLFAKVPCLPEQPSHLPWECFTLGTWQTASSQRYGARPSVPCFSCKRWSGGGEPCVPNRAALAANGCRALEMSLVPLGS